MPHAAGLHYEWHGDGGGAPLILSSGLGGSAVYWEPNIARIAAHRRVLVYDHRGTGRSDRALPVPITVEGFAQDILALMDALEIACADLIGHAASGVAGLALALAAPERIGRLVVVNGWARAEASFLRCFEARLALLRHVGIDAFLRAQPIFLYPANWIAANGDRLDAELRHQRDAFPDPESVERRVNALATFDIVDRLDRIDAPVLVIATRDDVLVPSRASERLAEGLPHATLAMLPYGGHAVNVVEQDAFDALVLGWLSDSLS